VFTLERPCYKHERSGLSATDMNTDDTESIRLSPVCTSLWQVPTCLVVCPLGRAVVSYSGGPQTESRLGRFRAISSGPVSRVYPVDALALRLDRGIFCYWQFFFDL